MADSNQIVWVFVGTYTRDGNSEGIYVYKMDPNTGALTRSSTAPKIENPSYVAVDPSHRYLYAVNEIREFDGQVGGAVSAFSIDPMTRELTLLNHQSTGGPGPCYVIVDQTGGNVLAANYAGGSVAVFPVQEDGRLGERSEFVQHEGSSVNPQRQQGPHAHSVILGPSNRFAFVADLGTDKMMVYKLDVDRGKLTPNETPWAQIEAGSGPRHFAFHPSGKYAYLINELGSTITAFTYDGEHGTLCEIQTVPTLPDGFEGRNHTADINISLSGKFLYGSNRGHDSLVIYGINQETGKLSYVGHESTQGETPRGFGIDPTGTFVLVANQGTDTIVTFRMNQETGKLEDTGNVAQVPKPVCVKMI